MALLGRTLRFDHFFKVNTLAKVWKPQEIQREWDLETVHIPGVKEAMAAASPYPT